MSRGADATVPEDPPRGSARALVWVIVLSQFAPPFMFSGVAVALPTMGLELHAGAVTLGLVETLFLAGSVAFLLPVGWLADASDKNTLYKLGLLGFGISSILIGVLSSMPAIVLIRFVQGIGSAVLAATGAAILADIVPPEQRGRAYGSSLGAIYAGLTLGPICAGVLIHVWSWRAVFFAGAALLLGAAGLVHRWLPSAWRRPERRLHVPSALLVIAAVLSLVAGSATVRVGWIGYAFLLTGLGLGAWFVTLQRGLDRPLVDIEALVRNRILRNALSVQLLVYLNAYSSIFMLSIYMQVSLGRSARTSGQVLAIGSVLMALVAPLAGRLADNWRAHRIASLGAACIWSSALLATTLHESSGLRIITAMLALQGLGYALFSSPNMTIIMNSVPAGSTSMAAALTAKARSLGMVFGMLITTVLIALKLGNDPIEGHPVEFVGTMVTVYSVLAVLTGLALALCVLTRPRQRKV